MYLTVYVCISLIFFFIIINNDRLCLIWLNIDNTSLIGDLDNLYYDFNIGHWQRLCELLAMCF